MGNVDEERKNSVSGDQLRGFVERIERLREDKKQISDDEKLVMAEAKSTGFVPKIIGHCIKVRAMKPSDYQESQALSDMYMSALGMTVEPPLFKHVGLMSVDVNAKEQVIEAMKKFVPTGGSITIEAGGVPIRLTRAVDGTVQQTEVQPQAPAAPSRAEPLKGSSTRPEPPSVDAEGAEALGAQAAKDDMPIIRNPFPFGDPRRARWDLGWRNQSGSDGMGPDD